MSKLLPWVFSGLGLVLLFWLTSPIPQDPAYYLFADDRTYLSVPNFWNVASNLPYAFVGIWGLVIVARGAPDTGFELRNAYAVFFVGVFITAFGSGYFHLEPNHSTLFWDRVPMTIAFAGLFAIVIGETLSPATGARWLPVFLLVGIGSVVYWAWTEAAGKGDLRPYAIVQFLPMLLIPAMLLFGKRENTIAPYVWWLIATYIVAKLFEHFDHEIFALPGLLSGHALKHLASAVGPAVFAVGLSRQLSSQRGTAH